MSTAEQPRVSRGLLIALGAVIGLAVLAGLWFFVVSPLLDDEPLAEPDTVELAEPPAPEPEEEQTPEPEPPPETQEVFTARDPFQQLVQPAVASTGTDDDDVADGDGDDSDSDDSDSDDGDGDDNPAPGARVGGTTIRLIDVLDGDDGITRVEVEVNGDTHVAAENEQFAERFKVLDISGDCATFLFGDNRFSLCKGESIRK